MGLSPIPPLQPERDRSPQYERDIAMNDRRRGPLRFEEGIATDTDVPNDFRRGAYADTANELPVTCIKGSGETMRERVHMGSSTWIEAPSLLSEFVHGAHGGFGTGYGYEHEHEGKKNRPNRAVVND